MIKLTTSDVEIIESEKPGDYVSVFPSPLVCCLSPCCPFAAKIDKEIIRIPVKQPVGDFLAGLRCCERHGDRLILEIEQLDMLCIVRKEIPASLTLEKIFNKGIDRNRTTIRLHLKTPDCDFDEIYSWYLQWKADAINRRK